VSAPDKVQALTGGENGELNRRAALLVLLVSVGVFALVLFRSALPLILGDYAEWVYHGVLLRNVLQGHPDAAYVLKHYPVPNSLTTAGLAVLMMLMSWPMAAKLWLMVKVLLGLYCAWELQRSAKAVEGWKAALVPAAVLFGTPFWFGFMNFMFGTYLAMLVCAVLLRGVESRWLYGVLLTLLFVTHMVPYGFALAVFAMYAWQHGRLKMLLQSIPSLLLSVWYFAGRMMHGDADGKAGMVSSVAYGTARFVVFKVNTYLKCWGMVNPAPNEQESILLRLVGDRVFALLFFANIVIALALFVLLATSAWRAIRDKTEQRFLWVVIAVFFVVALVMPSELAGLSDPGGRMMQVAVWTGMCVVTVRLLWLRRTLACCAGVLLAVNLFLLSAVASAPYLGGEAGGALPASVRGFAHVYYTRRWDYYGSIVEGRMDRKIYPTAMFLRREVDGGN
jgi:hypothetical protein